MGTAHIKLHLVDSAGKALDPDVVDAVERAAPSITARYRHVCDPAVIANCIEAVAQCVNKESVGGIRVYVRQKVLNRIVRNSREVAVGRETIESWAGATQPDQFDSVLWREVREAIGALPLRDRRVFEMHLQNATAKQIAAHYGLGVKEVQNIVARTREKIAQKFRS